MAGRLLAAGHRVSGWQRSRERAQRLIEQGLVWRESPRTVAEGADVVVTSLPDDTVLDAVATAPDGILGGLGEDTVWIDMSTVSPQTSRELAERVRSQGAWMLDAPVRNRCEIQPASDDQRRRSGRNSFSFSHDSPGTTKTGPTSGPEPGLEQRRLSTAFSGT
jgi:hypothetical protein